jgi:hypothetical protein
MKLCLMLIPAIVGLASVPCALLAADATVYPAYSTNTRAPLNYSAPGSSATTSSNAVMVGLNAQALLLKELAEEHQKRAAELTQQSQNEKAKWETDLVNELQEKSARLQKSIEQEALPGLGTNILKAAAEVDDELVFVSTVETGLERVRRELSAAIEDSRVLAMQIGTNKVPEDFAGLSLVLTENQRLVKELQREQFDLELRKLEFRAIRKVMQK